MSKDEAMNKVSQENFVIIRLFIFCLRKYLFNFLNILKRQRYYVHVKLIFFISSHICHLKCVEKFLSKSWISTVHSQPSMKRRLLPYRFQLLTWNNTECRLRKPYFPTIRSHEVYGSLWNIAS